MPSNKKKPVTSHEEQQESSALLENILKPELEQSRIFDIVDGVPIIIGSPTVLNIEEARKSFNDSCKTISSMVSGLPEEERKKLGGVQISPTFSYQGYDWFFGVKGSPS